MLNAVCARPFMAEDEDAGEDEDDEDDEDDEGAELLQGKDFVDDGDDSDDDGGYGNVGLWARVRPCGRAAVRPCGCKYGAWGLGAARGECKLNAVDCRGACAPEGWRGRSIRRHHHPQKPWGPPLLPPPGQLQQLQLFPPQFTTGTAAGALLDPRCSPLSCRYR